MTIGGITGGGDKPDDDDREPITGGEEVTGSEEEPESSDYKEPEYDHTYGYGIFNGVWDLGSAVRRKLAGDEPRYRDDADNPQALPLDQEKFGRRAFLGVARDATILGVAGGAAANLNSGNQTADNESDANTVTPPNGRVAYGEGNLSVEEGDALLEYLLRRTDTQGMPVDIEDLENYTDGDGIEMTGIHASLEEGQPYDDSIVEVQLDDGRSKTSNEAEDYAAEVLTEFADYDGTVDQYISDIEG